MPVEIVTVTLRGEIDIATVPRNRAILNDAIARQPNALIRIDMADVTFLDSSGISMLIGSHRRATGGGGSMAMINIHPRVLKVLEVTGLTGLLLDGTISG